MIDEFHPVQRKILSDLLFSNKLKYSQLKPPEMEGSQFTFHLNKLVDKELVKKDGDQYVLTPEGKNIANTFDPDSSKPTTQAKHSVVFCAFRDHQTLIYTRNKNPFYDHQGYPTGKVQYGEGILETAERELLEETGLRGNATLIGIRHFRVYHPTPNDLVEDKVMYVCRMENPIGELANNEEGEFLWVDLEKVAEVITKPLPEFQEIFNMLNNFSGEITFAERDHYPDQF